MTASDVLKAVLFFGLLGAAAVLMLLYAFKRPAETAPRWHWFAKGFCALTAWLVLAFATQLYGLFAGIRQDVLPLGWMLALSLVTLVLWILAMLSRIGALLFLTACFGLVMTIIVWSTINLTVQAAQGSTAQNPDSFTVFDGQTTVTDSTSTDAVVLTSLDQTRYFAVDGTYSPSQFSDMRWKTFFWPVGSSNLDIRPHETHNSHNGLPTYEQLFDQPGTYLIEYEFLDGDEETVQTAEVWFTVSGTPAPTPDTDIVECAYTGDPYCQE